MKLEEVIHLYLNCEVVVDGFKEEQDIAKLIGIVHEEAQLLNTCHNQHGSCHISLIKPILRKLEDMAEEEKNVLFQIVFGDDKTFGSFSYDPVEKLLSAVGVMLSYGIYEEQMSNRAFAYCLSKSIDLFSLVENGLAIDAKTLNQS